MKKRMGSLAIAALAIVCTDPVFSQDRCVESDHLLSYEYDSITELFSLGPVTLADQFMGGSETMAFDEVERILNPATKFHKGKIDKPSRPNTHYVAFSVLPDGFGFSFVTEVRVFNEFDRRTLQIPSDLVTNDLGDPIGLELLVPSVKKACPDGNCSSPCRGDNCFPTGDHYLCYLLDLDDDFGRCPANARFADQFLDSRIIDELVPTRICNPVDKTFNGVTTLSNRAETNHLMCYGLSDKRTDPRFVRTLNQLGEQSGIVEINDEICIPSTKVITGVDIP